MAKDFIIGRHYQTGDALRIEWENGVISKIETLEIVPEGSPTIAPTLTDVQNNGFAGCDFQRDDITKEELLAVRQALHQHGCSRILFTLITDQWDKLCHRIQYLNEIISSSSELSETFIGWHIEGPFMSPEPGFHGAHPPEHMLPPTPDKVATLRKLTGDSPLLLTMAPEWGNISEGIRAAKDLGAFVWLGHTNASSEQIESAVNAGATGFTHLGNGCTNALDRGDNIIYRIIDNPKINACLISDGIHVSPLLFRIMHRAMDEERITYTTDCMSAAGSPPGQFKVGPHTVEVGEDGIVRQPGKPNFAGSSLTPLEGVFRAARMLNTSLENVWHRFSDRFSDHLNLPPLWEIGRPADFCILTGPESARQVDVYIRGEKITEQTFRP